MHGSSSIEARNESLDILVDLVDGLVVGSVVPNNNQPPATQPPHTEPSQVRGPEWVQQAS
jgi:hypothetical protein